MKHFLLSFGAIALTACAGYSLRPGASEAEVRQAMGAPRLELPAADGSRELFYPTGPFGVQTHVAHLDRNGRLQGVDQLLRDERFNAIRPGMTSVELLHHLGPPNEKMRFANLSQTAWDYRFRDSWGYTAILSVMIDDQGTVATRHTRRLEPRDRF